MVKGKRKIKGIGRGYPRTKDAEDKTQITQKLKAKGKKIEEFPPNKLADREEFRR